MHHRDAGVTATPMLVFIVLFAAQMTAAAIAIPVRVGIAVLARDGVTIARYTISIAHGAGLAAWSQRHPYGTGLETSIVMLLGAAGFGSAAATLLLRGRARGPSLLILTETLCACLVAYSGAGIVLARGGGPPGPQLFVATLPNAFKIFAGALPAAIAAYFLLRAIAKRSAQHFRTPTVR